MKKTSTIVWGILLILFGAVFALRALDLIPFDIFFDGWWTLIIIIPGVVGLITEREKFGNIICILVGVVLLLACQNIVNFELIGKLIVPAVIVIIGARMIWGALSGKDAEKIMDEMKERGEAPKEGNAAFSGCDMNFSGQNFQGCELNATFGGVKCDLRGAIIESDAAIKATAVFGGIDIIAPTGVNVKVTSNSIFGGVSNKTAKITDPEAKTIYINALCMFGGVTIK